MAEIVSSTVTITFSKLVKSGTKNPGKIVTNEDLEILTQAMNEIFPDDVRVIEVAGE